MHVKACPASELQPSNFTTFSLFARFVDLVLVLHTQSSVAGCLGFARLYLGFLVVQTAAEMNELLEFLRTHEEAFRR